MNNAAISQHQNVEFQIKHEPRNKWTLKLSNVKIYLYSIKQSPKVDCCKKRIHKITENQLKS